MRGRLTPRIVVAGAMLAVLIALAFGLLWRTITDEHDVSAEARTIRRELGQLAELEESLLRLDAGARQLALVGESDVTAWEGELSRFEQLANGLDGSAVDDAGGPSAREIVSESRTLVDEHLGRLATWTSGLTPELEGALEAAAADLDALASSFDVLEEERTQLLLDRQASSDAATERGLVVALIGVGGSIALLVAFGAYLVRSVLWPLRSASTMADRLAQGDLSVRMRTDGIGELGQLQRSFNTMGETLERTYADLLGLLDEQAALHRVAALVASGVRPQAIFDLVVEEIRRVLGADVTILLRRSTHSVVTIVASEDRIGVVERGSVWPRSDPVGDGTAALTWTTSGSTDLAGVESVPLVETLAAGGIEAVVHAPIVVDGKVWGGVVSGWAETDIDSPRLAERTAAFTELVGTAIANAESLDQLIASRARVVAAGDAARRRIERDIHDGIQQRLVSLALQLRRVEHDADPSLSPSLSAVSSMLAGAIDELQEVSRGIHPAILTQGGLGPAMRTLARRAEVRTEVTVEGSSRLSEPVEVALYYVAAEALTNAAKHAGATHVELELRVTSEEAELSVRDDGRGGADPARGSGLLGLRDRVESVGGQLVVVSPPGSGTSMKVAIPLADADRAR